MVRGYCKNCRREVSLRKNDFDWCLFILLMFTGIGPCIYVFIWMIQPTDRCTFCGRKTEPSRQEHNTQSPQQIRNYGRYSSSPQTPSLEHPKTQEMGVDKQMEYREEQKVQKTTEAQFCPYCGAQIRQGARFCANCQSPVRKL